MDLTSIRIIDNSKEDDMLIGYRISNCTESCDYYNTTIKRAIRKFNSYHTKPATKVKTIFNSCEYLQQLAKSC